MHASIDHAFAALGSPFSPYADILDPGPPGTEGWVSVIGAFSLHLGALDAGYNGLASTTLV